MRDSEFCTQILKLDDGWTANTIEVDEPSNRIDISISYGTQGKRGFFKRNQETESTTLTLRHLPLMGMRTYLTVPEPSDENGNKSWTYAGSKLTKEMEDFVISAIKTCKSIQGVSDITGLSPSEVREVSERTGEAIERVETAPEPQTLEPDSHQTAAMQSFELIDCQIYSEHLASLGAKTMRRGEFSIILNQHCSVIEPHSWSTQILEYE